MTPLDSKVVHKIHRLRPGLRSCFTILLFNFSYHHDWGIVISLVLGLDVGDLAAACERFD